MARFWLAALLALVPAGTGVAQVATKQEREIKRINAKLSLQDPRDTRRDAPCKIYSQRMSAGKVYTIDMVSSQFDAYLRLEDQKGNQLDEDDDSGGGLNARMVFNCSRDDEYKIICTSFNAQGEGNFTLTVKESMQTVRLGTPHQALVGKAAPDFEGDFAVNGKPVRLSDLKGKVVLLAFWEVQSGPSVTAFPRLRDWHKAHHAEGLEVVGVTYYNFEIGQKLGFDKENGQLKRLDHADRATEQAMLQAFAAHHKLDFRLMVLPREDAIDTFDAYAVNGLPQFVLIDRRGNIRLIRVGEDAATATALTNEMKKLLAEK
jgi:peroxiredoxin